ncbi:hypothetical protein EMIHUDRAFT_223217 [Emiliania huxleyi CCMP1516]|uniref:AP2/ERF domain-containing protein n=2 Tax=Emiliania huxleyi TaxID=2903 RepID=A0A0D3KW60_EMIH1|nr:hypothetical protein EMIHUDRAFT_223217 [Emiliania huxleyi CCMP1516]EOD39995.1 hypothetical protein EMIHUDRAFT_223217 [Emiliania huxleyi CCMP1516]|eukprot:XP_005792424.1 hypothetical protein EMIHUDRAFT_223217 [Emiliania huxleyi CCMP1516]
MAFADRRSSPPLPAQGEWLEVSIPMTDAAVSTFRGSVDAVRPDLAAFWIKLRHSIAEYSSMRKIEAPMRSNESEAHTEPPPDGGAKRGAQRRDLELARGCTVEAFYARRLQDKAIRETAVGTPPPPLDLGHYARLSDTQKLRVYTAYVAHGGASPPNYVVERRSRKAGLPRLCFDTAVAAAVAYARVVGEYQPAVATEAEGLRLQLCSSSGTGYKGVRKRASGRFQAEHKVDGGRRVSLGTFATAVEAAVAYTRAVGEAERQEAPPRPAKRSLKPADAPPPKRRSTAAWPSAASVAEPPRLQRHPIGMPPVVQALERVGLPQYADAFDEQGYDDLNYILEMDAAERKTVAEATGMRPGHAAKFVKLKVELHSSPLHMQRVYTGRCPKS